jgi:acetyl-CoA carboxylase biotin carboxyl carrier protein
LDLKEIRQIIEMMKRHDLSLFHLERDGMKIKLKKGVDYDAFLSSMQTSGGGMGVPMAPAPAASGLLPQASQAAEAPAAETPSAPATGGPVITSPMVGTFYRSPGPGESPFLKEGDRIEEGSLICIIEAMKVMNEIKAETSGTVSRILVDDGTAVQYGQPLFELK